MSQTEPAEALQDQVLESIEPSYRQVRERIDGVKPESRKMALRAHYLWASRRCEVTGKYAFTGDRMKLMKYRPEWYGPDDAPEDVVVFQVIPAKVEEEGEEAAGLEVLPRSVAIPLKIRGDVFDPWIPELVEHIQKSGSGKVWKFSDKTLYRAAEKAFGPKKNEPGFKYKIMVGRRFRWRDLKTHGVRHFRIDELVNVCGFDGIDIVAYAGWSPRTVNMPAIMKRYASLQWRRYIDKFFVRRMI